MTDLLIKDVDTSRYFNIKVESDPDDKNIRKSWDSAQAKEYKIVELQTESKHKLAEIIPRIRVTCHKTGKIYEGYYFEMPETTNLFETGRRPATIHILIQYEMTDWGLPNKIVPIKIENEDEIEIIYGE